MTRNGRSSGPDRVRSSREPQYEDAVHYSPNAGQLTNASTNQADITQDVAHMYQSSSASDSYPQTLELDPHHSHYSNQQYEALPAEPFWDEVSRCWRYANPNVHEMAIAPAYNSNYRAPSSQNHQSDSDRIAAMYVERRRPTEAKFEVLDIISPPTNSMVRYEQQGQRVGPWDGVGYVRNERGR